jgi:hypothetical protein
VSANGENAQVITDWQLAEDTPAGPIGPEHGHDAHRAEVEADARLDMLIGRRMGHLALDFHWPLVQIQDSLAFLEAGFDFFERSGRPSESGAPDARKLAEFDFYRREVPGAMAEARQAVELLNIHRTGLFMTARSASEHHLIWSPATLVEQCALIGDPVWRDHFHFDTTTSGLKTLRCRTPARPLLSALIDVCVAIVSHRLAADNRTITLGLYREEKQAHLMLETSPKQARMAPVTARIEHAARRLARHGWNAALWQSCGAMGLRVDIPEAHGAHAPNAGA